MVKLKKEIVKTKRVNNPHGRPQELTPKEIMDAYSKSMGFKSMAAKKLGCSTTTLQNYEKKYPEIKEYWINEVKEQRDDNVEGQLFKAINEGNMTGIIFYMKTQMKHRGYTEQDNSAKFIIQNINKIDLKGLSDEQLQRISNGNYAEIFRGTAIESESGNGIEGTEALEVIEQ